MPVYNEMATLRTIVERVLAVIAGPGVDTELICIDDGSTDGSRELLAELAAKDDRIRVVLHEVNQGKAGALQTGFRAAKGDLVIIQDADLEYDPEEFPKIMAPLLDGRAEVVFGSRFQGPQQRVHLFLHYIANRMLTLFSNICTNLNLTDMECCYKAFRREVLDALTIQSRRFAVEPELTQKVAKLGVRVYEVGCSYHGRDYSEGKKIGFSDAIEAVWAILRFKIFWYPPRDFAISRWTLRRSGR
ncbi:MAG: glycosyltransferase family 2 protein [Planctomycetes bacterium]|nr:glycosyltransferase family 2 protein [Planctomycetota bacterium]